MPHGGPGCDNVGRPGAEEGFHQAGSESGYFQFPLSVSVQRRRNVTSSVASGTTRPPCASSAAWARLSGAARFPATEPVTGQLAGRLMLPGRAFCLVSLVSLQTTNSVSPTDSDPSLALADLSLTNLCHLVSLQVQQRRRRTNRRWIWRQKHRICSGLRRERDRTS